MSIALRYLYIDSCRSEQSGGKGMYLLTGAQAIRLPPEKHPARDVMSEFASFLLAVAQGPRELAPRNFTRSFV